MSSLKSRLCPFVLAAALLTGAADARAALLKVSPFLPPAGAANSPTQNAPLEYRGSMQMGDVEQFRVVDPARKIGVWLKLGEHDANLDVGLKQYDPAQDTITLDHGGQSLTLQLKKGKVNTSGAIPTLPPPPIAAQMNVSPAVIQTVVPNPTPADEQRRLEAVAAEVARRRALREQAAQQARMQAAGGLPPVQPNVSRADQIQAMQAQRRARGGR